MPEYPDVVVYIEALEKRIVGQTLKRVELKSAFVLRTAVPPLSAIEGKQVQQLRRLGKRICLGLADDFWLVIHLMIAGRLHWNEGKVKPTRSQRLAALVFSNGTLVLTEAGTQKRASLHVVSGQQGLESLNAGGAEVFEIDLKRFAEILRARNHTLKRALTDPRLLSGIGNAYSDEILFEAGLSPVALTQKLTDSEMKILFETTRATLTTWAERLRADSGDKFPEKVTAFRPDMAVHGRYKQPCPRCGATVQRIRYASNETNYCPNCQTGGKLLADRTLSRLLRSDWPKTPDELDRLTAKDARQP